MRSSGTPEARRHRLAGSLDDDELLDWQRRRPKENEKKRSEDCGPGSMEKQRKLKSFALRLLLILLFAAASLTVLFVPASFRSEHELRTAAEHSKLSFPSGLVSRNFSLDNESTISDESRISAASDDDRLLAWLKFSAELTHYRGKIKEDLKVGLVNFESSHSRKWEDLSGAEMPKHIYFQPVSRNISWSDLFPEWIDEEEQWHTPRCPPLPMPSIEKDLRLHLVVAKVQCDQSHRYWSRDVNRLHTFLATAKVAADTGDHKMYVLLSDECRPTPNLFTCDELVEHQDGIWLYKVNLKKLRKKLALPVGSCQLAVPLKTAGKVHQKNAAREAYATILHSAQIYVCGAISLAQSIRMTGSFRDLVILVDESIHPHHREGLEAAGWKVREIQRIRNPKAEPSSYNEWNYSKFRLWQLTQYEKLIYIDADIIVLRNLDFLFEVPEISATGNHESLFNSGVMVIEPSNCTFEVLMQDINEVESYNGGDQGFLNEVYTWWHRLPKHMNFLKHFGVNDTEEIQHRFDLFTAEPPRLYAMHFLGIKPWLCFRDYDCNWNQRKLHDYANDAVHAQWWKIHDSMPENLQSYCLLRSKQKASLEWDRRQAEADQFEDGHWKIKIRDPRLQTCFEDFCFWESMLWHWGETNATEGAL